MKKKTNISTRDLLSDLVTSDINLARAFAVVARSAYSLGKLEEAEFARSRAINFYCEALRSVLQMPKRDREAFSSDVQHLRTIINWLSMQTVASRNSPPEKRADASLEELLKLLEEKG